VQDLRTAKRVFVSYASQDAAIAESVCTVLERDGLSCWIAPRDVMPGDFFAEAIVQAISTASIVVLVLSGRAIASPHVIREVDRACAKRRPIIVLRIDAEPLTPALEYFLSDSQWLDASILGVDRSLPMLLQAVRRRVPEPPAPEPKAKDRSQPEPTVKPGEGERGLGPARNAAIESPALVLFLLLLGGVGHGGSRG
jgi:hypothetical protein